MARPGNRHCANCIGTILFPIATRPAAPGTIDHLTLQC